MIALALLLLSCCVSERGGGRKGWFLLTLADERRQLYARWCGIHQTVSQPELPANSIALRKT